MIDSQRARVRLRTVQSMVKTGVTQPEKIPPWLRDQALKPVTHVPSHLAAFSTTTALPDQRSRIERLRDSGDYLLIVLDACRFDAFWDVFANDLVGKVEPVASGGRDTFEYLQVIWPDSYNCLTSVPPSRSTTSLSTSTRRVFITSITATSRERTCTALTTCGRTPGTGRSGLARRTGVVAGAGVPRRRQPRGPLPAAAYTLHRRERELGHAGTEAAVPGQVAPVDKPIWDRVESGEISDERLGSCTGPTWSECARPCSGRSTIYSVSSSRLS